METKNAIIEKTRLVKDFALGSVDARQFVECYSNFYYYEALDGHEACSLLWSEILMGLGPAIELHRRIQEEVINNISFDEGFSIEVLRMAGRITPSEARERAMSICTDIGIEVVLSTISAA